MEGEGSGKRGSVCYAMGSGRIWKGRGRRDGGVARSKGVGREVVREGKVECLLGNEEWEEVEGGVKGWVE